MRFQNIFSWIYAKYFEKNCLECCGEPSKVIESNRQFEYARMKIREKSLNGVIDHFSSFLPPPHPQTNFLLRSGNSRAINITSFWPEKERAQTNRKTAHETRENDNLRVNQKWAALRGMMKGKNPKRICSIVVMMNLQRSTFFLSSACCYLPILFSGLINWLINNKISSHAFHPAAHMETLLASGLPIHISLVG